jgi:hypothetical protein
MTHINEDDLVLHYYGEMDAGEESHAAAHLAECAACQAKYTTLQRVLAAVEAEPVPEPREGFERTVWARLQPELAPRRGWVSSLVWSPVNLGLAAAVLVLVIGAFYAGRGWQRTVSPASTQAAAADAAMRERVLLVDLGEHLDRSQTMLVELVSAGGAGTIDISSERDRAEQLVESNRLYRQAAEANGDTALTALLDELERVLVDVAASPATLSAADMEDVRQRIDNAGLLFKVRVVSSEVRERQKRALRARAGQSS